MSNLFESDRQKWEWIKENTPDIAELVLDVNRIFGKPDHVEIFPADPSALIAARDKNTCSAADEALTRIREKLK